ncbi:hypothetical protein FRZ61_36650 [Hypericibacter adhaerens]|uniref:Uncharacterized protein n=1 Tax=Hypericibacter adhaerens TaxID=2602016 RepID=A0A5J6N8R9_9PROT|nr:hypothetical protein FRZ61_36650 [Hypericibacter adhaerens]
MIAVERLAFFTMFDISRTIDSRRLESTASSIGSNGDPARSPAPVGAFDILSASSCPVFYRFDQILEAI